MKSHLSAIDLRPLAPADKRVRVVRAEVRTDGTAIVRGVDLRPEVGVNTVLVLRPYGNDWRVSRFLEKNLTQRA